MTTTLQELLAKATPDQWTAEPHSADRTTLIYGPLPHQRLVAELSPATRFGGPEMDANAALIVHARRHIGPLVEALEAFVHPDGLSSANLRNNLEHARKVLTAAKSVEVPSCSE